MSPVKPQRIAKWIANCGVASRRQAEQWILEGRVTYQGNVVDSPILLLESPEGICVDGNALYLPDQIRVWGFYKPRGVFTTRHDPQERPTVYDYIPSDLGHIMKVGRLDIESEGLLLFTNNGDYARELEHPSSGLLRTYRVRVYGDFDPQQMKQLEKGVTIEGVHYKPIRWKVDPKRSDKQTWLTLTLSEGKNREIRNMMRFLGLQVSRLIRTQYGDFTVGVHVAGDFWEVQL